MPENGQGRGPVLLTAFDPFGILAPILKSANRSEEVCGRVTAFFGFRDVEYLKLPVSDAGIHRLGAALAAGPRAVVMTGENPIQWHPVVIEGRAFDPKLQHLGLGFPLRQAIASPAAPEMKRLTGVPVSNSPWKIVLNGYFCNTANWEGVRWSERTGRPSVFLHLCTRPFPFILDRQVEEVARVVRALL